VKVFFFLGFFVALVLSSAVSHTQTATAQTNSAGQLAGLWEAKRRFGPDIRGSLLLKQNDGGWQAEIAGRVVQAKTAGDTISFELPDGMGKFQGKFDVRRTKIVGHWIQSKTVESGMHYASPVTLAKDKQNVWRGEVSPIDDTMTFYLMVKVRDDGSVGAFLKNPERNLGWTNFRVDHIEREGESVKLIAANNGTEKGRVLATGRYDAENELLSIYFPTRGGTFDFRQVDPNQASDFYPRGRPTGNYVYAPPPALDDGWQTTSLDDVGIARDGIEKFIQMIVDTPIDSVNTPAVHGILIARNGKLVLEEYFYGENREKPHDTRSATKSVASDLTGAAIYAGVPLKVSVPVYQIMNGGVFPTDLDARKRALTLEHLLTMSSGFECDDNDPKSPGFEDNMWEQTEQPDFYKWTMDLNMIRQPGEKAVYCSANPNLVGGVVSRAAKQSSPTLFQNLIAEPLQMKRYYLPLSPLGDYTMTGGARFLPREFMKLGQLHINGGTWNGRRVFTPEWSRRAISPLYEVKGYKPPEPYKILRYGYLWWVIEYPFKGRTVQAFFAGGNGGQTVMGIPELDLVIAIYAGNYADSPGRQIQQAYVPKYILPAIVK